MGTSVVKTLRAGNLNFKTVLNKTVVYTNFTVTNPVCFNPFTPKSVEYQNSREVPNSMVPCIGKVLPKRFHLNGHTIQVGFCRQSQKLDLHFMSS